jgi:hypothetical protein
MVFFTKNNDLDCICKECGWSLIRYKIKENGIIYLITRCEHCDFYNAEKLVIEGKEG